MTPKKVITATPGQAVAAFTGYAAGAAGQVAAPGRYPATYKTAHAAGAAARRSAAARRAAATRAANRAAATARRAAIIDGANETIRAARQIANDRAARNGGAGSADEGGNEGPAEWAAPTAAADDGACQNCGGPFRANHRREYGTGRITCREPNYLLPGFTRIGDDDDDGPGNGGGRVPAAAGPVADCAGSAAAITEQGAFDFAAAANEGPGPVPPLPAAGEYKYDRYTARTRDTQRQRVYDWEAQDVRPLAANPAMPHDEIQNLITRICHDYGLPTIRVETSAGRRGWFRTRPAGDCPPAGAAIVIHHHTGEQRVGRICLPATDWTSCALYALHEMAHYIVAANYGHGKVPSHGPEFAAIAATLWERYTGRNRETMLAAAAARKIRVAE